MSHRAVSVFLSLALILLAASRLNAQAAPASPAPTPPSGYITIHNDFYSVDSDGARILTRSGCLRQFNGIYYWYGGNPRGFREQYCYTSTDLVHWTNKGIIFRQDFDANRMDVLYNDSTKQYVMFLKYNGNGAHFGIATSPTPDGQFTFKSQTLVDNALIGDMSMFKDDDGTAYLCYVSWAVGTNAQHGLYRMSPDYLTLDKRMYLWDIKSREAPNIFKRNGIYYYGNSRTAGIQSSGTAYYTATNPAGPWTPATPLSTPGSNNTWDTQIDFVHPFVGTQATVYMFAGDRWVKNAQTGRNGDYVWLPMEFDGDTPILNYYQDWDLNVTTGTWRKFDPARDLARGKPVTASSEVGPNVADHVTAATTWQDYLNTRWQSAPGDMQWIMVDLGAPTDVNRVILKWDAAAAKSFKVQTSTDAATWTDVFTTTQGSSATVTDETFPTTSARYVRMFATQRAAIPFAGGRGGFGRGRGRGPQTAPGRATTQPFTARAIATQPAVPGGYSLFEFMVLKD
jgi:hypothetical protein